MNSHCVVCARSFEDTGEIISGNAVRFAIVETVLLPYRLVQRHMRDRKNKILAKRMARAPEPVAEHLRVRASGGAAQDKSGKSDLATIASPETVSAKAQQAGADPEETSARVVKPHFEPHFKPHKVTINKISLRRQYGARVEPVTHEVAAPSEHPREHRNVKQSLSIAALKGPATHQCYRKRMSSRSGTVIHIHHDDDLDMEAEHATFEAEKAAVEANAELTAEQEPTQTPASDVVPRATAVAPLVQIAPRYTAAAQQTHEPKSGERQPRRCSKRWWKQKLANLWYIIRKEHALIGMLVPLTEELAVFTRFQMLWCFYVEIQLALAAAGLFVGP